MKSAPSTQVSRAGSPSRTPRPDITEEESCLPEEDLSAILGLIGPFQRNLMAYSSFAMMVSAMHSLLYVIFAPEDVPHWCRLPDAPANTTLEEWKAINIPRRPDGSLSGCYVYAAPADSNETLPCPHRSFGVHSNKATIIEEWDMVCDRAWLYTAGENIFLLGSFFGLSVSGLSADRVGRKPVVCLSVLVLEVAGVSMYSVESLVLFIAFRFLVAASSVALAYTNYVLLVELVALPQRAMYGTLVLFGYVVGVLLANVIVGMSRDWRMAQIIVMVPTTLLLAGFWLLLESPRWLIITLRVREAVRSVSLILRRNRVPRKRIMRIQERLRQEPLQMLHGVHDSSPKTTGRRRAQQAHELEESEKGIWDLLDIVITQYQLSTVGLTFCWFACSITFYGIAIDMDAKNVSDSLASFVTAFAAPLAAYLLIVRRGRRDVLANSMAAAGACCLLVAASLQRESVHRFLFVLSAWFAINIAYSVLFLYATEIYPTTIRALGFNLGAAIGRIGTLMAPLLYNKLQDRQDGTLLSYIVLSLTCFLSGFLVTKLPETKETHLPEKIKPEENLFDFGPMSFSGVRRWERARKPETESTGEYQRAFGLIMALFQAPDKEHSGLQSDARSRKTSAAMNTVDHPEGGSVEEGLSAPDVVAQADPTDRCVAPAVVVSGEHTKMAHEAELEEQHAPSPVVLHDSPITKDSGQTAVESLREDSAGAEHSVSPTSAARSPLTEDSGLTKATGELQHKLDNLASPTVLSEPFSPVSEELLHMEEDDELRLPQGGPGSQLSASPVANPPGPRSQLSSCGASPRRVSRRSRRHLSPKSPALHANDNQLQAAPNGEMSPAKFTSGGASSAISPESSERSPQHESSHRAHTPGAPFYDSAVHSVTEGHVSETTTSRRHSGRRRRKRRPRHREPTLPSSPPS